MTYQECKNQVLKLLNQYTIAGSAVADGYNNQADYIRRIPSLINDAMMEISTTVRKLEALCDLRVGGAQSLTITSQPADATGELDSYVSFAVEVLGDGVTYLWYSNTSGVWKKTSFSSSKKSVLTVKVTEVRDGKQFRCKVTDQYGNTVTSNAATLHVGTPTPVPAPTPVMPQNEEGNYVSMASLTDVQAQFVMPPDMFQIPSGNVFRYFDGSVGSLGHLTTYTFQGRRCIIVPREFIKSGGTLLYWRYPVMLPEDDEDIDPDTELDNTEDVHRAIPYYVAGALAMHDDPFLAATLMNGYEDKLAKMEPPVTAEANQAIDVYDFYRPPYAYGY
jgi:hypothetical protein